MIEAMKTVTLVALARYRDETLDVLRSLEAMHVQLLDRTPSDSLTEASKKLESVHRAVGLLGGVLAVPEGADPFAGLDPENLFLRIQELQAQVLKLTEHLDALRRNEELLAPWGEFDPASLAALRGSGLDVRLVLARESEMPEFPSHATVREINRIEDRVYLVVISDRPITAELPEATLPEGISLGALGKEIAETQNRLSTVQAELAHAARHIGTLNALVTRLADREEFLAARDGMGEEAELCYLSGYVPVRRIPALSAAASQHGWALQVEDPDPDDISVPTLITVPKWLKVSKPIFDFVGITPGYREFDISAWFLIFFSLFFGILVGDGGYGVLFLAATLFARRKAKGDARTALNLLMILSICTITWGFLTGNYFGINKEVLPTFMQGVPWLAEFRNVQMVVFLIGAIHLSIAHTVKGISVINSTLALSQLGWMLIVWGNFFLGTSLVTGRETPFFLSWLYIAGAAMVILFSVRNANILKAVGAGTGSLLGSLVNSFVDVLSYIRLFAVGLSSYYVAVSFNNMGMNIFEGSTGVVAIALFLMGAVIIVFGHVLNIALCCLGVMVHGIRLNTLEFSGHLGLEWTGTPFRAFAKRFSKE